MNTAALCWPDKAGALVEWARHGPRAAVVDQVSVQAEPPEGLTGFIVQ